MYFSLKIKVPAIIESVIVYFLLRHRKKHKGYAFRRIKLINGKVKQKIQYAVVDPEDYQKLSQYDWQFFEKNTRCYAAVFCDGGILYMHRFIMNASKGQIIDHRNNEGLDNRKANLRFATISQNNYNKKPVTKNNTSRFRGVQKKKGRNKYHASIGCNGKHIYLGTFYNEEDAARAYDEAAKKYYGEFAILNFEEPSVFAKGFDATSQDAKAQRNKDVKKQGDIACLSGGLYIESGNN